ncbi:MAG: dihydroneopterin aldolase [Cyanobacteria bacterium]|nr:dihydroneopterin aldolase [Cyanobacteriota bacterium]
MDRIYISKYRCYGYTGYLPEEKVLGQWFEVDATIDVDLAAAGRSDRIEETLDYRRAIACIREITCGSKADLIEWVAESIAAAILELKGAQRVTVRVTKPAAPLQDFNGTLAVEVTRDRAGEVA